MKSLFLLIGIQLFTLSNIHCQNNYFAALGAGISFEIKNDNNSYTKSNDLLSYQVMLGKYFPTEKGNFEINLSLLRKGYKYKITRFINSSKTRTKISIHMIEFDLLYNHVNSFKFKRRKRNLFLGFGGYCSVNLSENYKYADLVNNSSPGIKTFDFGLVGNIGYQKVHKKSRFGYHLRYSHGLHNFLIHPFVQGQIRNIVFIVKYRLGK